MKITTVTVGLRRTESLPEYRNIAPSLILTAELEPGDDWPQVEQRLKSNVEAHIEAWIDDELEKAGQPAKFSKEPRYSLWLWTSADILIILPVDQDPSELPGNWRIYYGHVPPRQHPLRSRVFRRDVDLLRRLVEGHKFSGHGHRLPFLHRVVEQIRQAGQMQVSGDGEFLSTADLDLYIWQYLTLGFTWSIVRIDAREDSEGNWDTLGYIAVSGNTLLQIMENDNLCWILSHGRSVGSRQDIEVFIRDSSIGSAIAIAETPEAFDTWVQERLRDLGEEDDE